ncbi:MAG: hypothetical protein M0Z71_14500 [Nitrospiraceae bacterium]|nr:hypothetical protein [Nitrospiraceae bacterium]
MVVFLWVFAGIYPSIEFHVPHNTTVILYSSGQIRVKTLHQKKPGLLPVATALKDLENMDSRLRGNDAMSSHNKKLYFEIGSSAEVWLPGMKTAGR